MSLTATVLHAVLFTGFVWWFTTGAILYLDGLPQRTFKLSMAVATAALVGALYGLWATQSDTSVWGAYLAFMFALVAWGWNEMAFLMGFITGPRRTACPPGAEGLLRLKFATETVLWHEIAIALTALAIFAATADAANKVGFQTFAILWVLRLSAKINVFLGVRNFSEEFLPPHLRYLETYFRRSSMNAAFPISVTLTTLLVGALASAVMVPGASAFEITAATLLATLAALALLEHWMLVLPLSTTALWKWGLASRDLASREIGLREIGPLEMRSVGPAPSAQVSSLSLDGAPAAQTIVPFPVLSTKTPRRR
jgi:putative photosynthetic complex assembly protein 2